jgi:hypothetical protein
VRECPPKAHTLMIIDPGMTASSDGRCSKNKLTKKYIKAITKSGQQRLAEFFATGSIPDVEVCALRVTCALSPDLRLHCRSLTALKTLRVAMLQRCQQRCQQRCESILRWHNMLSIAAAHTTDTLSCRPETLSCRSHTLSRRLFPMRQSFACDP